MRSPLRTTLTTAFTVVVLTLTGCGGASEEQIAACERFEVMRDLAASGSGLLGMADAGLGPASNRQVAAAVRRPINETRGFAEAANDRTLQRHLDAAEEHVVATQRIGEQRHAAGQELMWDAGKEFQEGVEHCFDIGALDPEDEERTSPPER